MQRLANISDYQEIVFGDPENSCLLNFQNTDNQYRYSHKITPNSTGKELDAETDYSYFGARYLEHDLMTGWQSVDPMADKYPSLSPYAYCAWNPVKLVDPDGSDCTETDIINKYNGKCVHIEDGKNRIVILDNKSFQHIQSFKVSSYEDMTHLQRITFPVLMAIGVEVTLNSTLGKMARAVYAEMGDLNSSEQDRCIVAATIATRLKTDKDIDKVLVPKQYNAVSSNVYKIGFYNEELRLKKESPTLDHGRIMVI